MKKFAAAAGPSITLVVALVMLFASVTAFLLVNSLWNQLQETRGQLEEVQAQLQDAQSKLPKAPSPKDQQQKTDKGGAGPAGGQPETVVNKSQPRDNAKDPQDSKSPAGAAQGQQRAILIQMQGDDGGASLPYLLLLSLGLVVLASLVLVLVSALALLFGGSTTGRSRAEPSASPLSHTETSHTEHASALNPSYTETLNVEHASPLKDGRWMKLVEECVEVVDELDEHMGTFDPPRRELAGHVMLRLEEILGRSGVEIISNDTTFDRTRHKADTNHPAATESHAAVSETLSPGFAVGPRVLRRARVRLE